MGKEEGWTYIAMDESNHGRFPEIFVSIYSNMPRDAIISEKPFIPKKRNNHKTLLKKLEKRNYSFLLLTRDESPFIDKDKIPGIIIASLIQGKYLNSPLHLYVDGELSERKKDYIMGALSETTPLDREGIFLYSGTDLDRRVMLVNIADETAHWLFKKPLEKIAGHPKQKTLLRGLL